MAGRKTVLTTELINEICGHIQAGAYDYIAAERVGIAQRTFYNWLEKGEAEDADPIYVQFLQAVEQAKANARASAELRVMKEQPATWLLKGPGREKPGRPGWSNEATVNLQSEGGPIKLTWAIDSEAGALRQQPEPSAIDGQVLPALPDNGAQSVENEEASGND